MAFADPQSVTISGTTISLPRVSSGTNSGAFQSNDGLVRESVSHSYGNKVRRVIRLDHSKTAADPLITGNNAVYSMSVALTTVAPKAGYTVAEQKAVVDGFIAQLQATSGALETKLLGGES